MAPTRPSPKTLSLGHAILKSPNSEHHFSSPPRSVVLPIFAEYPVYAPDPYSPPGVRIDQGMPSNKRALSPPPFRPPPGVRVEHDVAQHQHALAAEQFGRVIELLLMFRHSPGLRPSRETTPVPSFPFALTPRSSPFFSRAYSSLCEIRSERAKNRREYLQLGRLRDIIGHTPMRPMDARILRIAHTRQLVECASCGEQCNHVLSL